VHARLRNPEYWLYGLFVLLKLILVSDQRLAAIYAPLDDTLYARLADSLCHGLWLGPYDNQILAKGMMYPLFVAFAHALHVPLLTAHHATYAIACLVAVFALRPVLTRQWLRISAFVVLLFLPGEYTATRISRDALYDSVTLLTLAAGLALVLRPRRPPAWVALYGLSAAAFWFTRDESLWLVPSLLLLTLAILVQARRESVVRCITVALVPWLCIAATWLTIATLNLAHYGWFAPRELLTRDFQDAYGSLMRVHETNMDVRVPVPAAVRARLYDASPAFRELQPFIEGDLGAAWSGLGRISTDLAPVYEFKGGWFIWVFRDAVACAGYYTNGAAARAYYRRLAAEINGACADGRLRAGPAYSGLAMPWKAAYLPGFVAALSECEEVFLRMPDFPHPQYSLGEPSQLRFLADMARESIAPLNDPQPAPWINPLSERIRRAIARLYAAMFGVLFLGSIVAAGAAALRGKNRLVLGLAACALLAAVAVRLALLSYIHATSFPAFMYTYTSVQYIPAVLFCILAWGWLLESRRA